MLKEDAEFSHGYLLDLLKDNEVIVTFTKKDGSDRNMRCTLQESELPKRKTKTSTNKPVNTEILKVYDLDKKAWRSFRVESIKSFQFSVA